MKTLTSEQIKKITMTKLYNKTGPLKTYKTVH